ncbi:hypothetical protein FB446DRAFT_656326 [Lentinula raphanica]|nr:hypothetical protein FB446DRAFT_656326 [Lentinula raphanica]
MSTPHVRPATKGPAFFPGPGSSKAPKKFRGDGTQLADFFLDFETNAREQELTDEEKVRLILRYLDTATCDHVTTLQGYKDGDWSRLKEDMLDAYPGSRKGHQYTRSHLQRLANEHARKRLDDEETFADYHHKFCRIADRLTSDGRLTTEEAKRYFWHGIHKVDRRQILFYVRMRSQDADLKDIPVSDSDSSHK